MKYMNDAIETTEIDACMVQWRKYVNRQCWFGELKSIIKDDGTSSETRSLCMTHEYYKEYNTCAHEVQC